MKSCWMTLIWKSLLRQTWNICTDLVSDSSNADIHPQLSASQSFLWERKRSSTDGRFHEWVAQYEVWLQWSGAPSPLQSWGTCERMNICTPILPLLTSLGCWYGVQICVRGLRETGIVIPITVLRNMTEYILSPPPLSLALFKEKNKSAIFTRMKIWKTNSKREFQRPSSCLTQLSSWVPVFSAWGTWLPNSVYNPWRQKRNFKVFVIQIDRYLFWIWSL